MLYIQILIIVMFHLRLRPIGIFHDPFLSEGGRKVRLQSELENGFEKNLGLKKTKKPQVKNVGFFILWSNLIQITFNFMF